MDFKIPSEFADFVSDPFTIFNEFQSDISHSAGDIVRYNIHKLGKADLEVMQSLQNEIEHLVRPLVGQYVWHGGSFQLSIVMDHSEVPPIIYLDGNVNIMGNIEDEWFIVFLLLTISKGFSDVAITVTDSDGQFILAEAADFIPEWIGPDNSANRVWLKEARVYILGGDSDYRNIALSEALSILRSESSKLDQNYFYKQVQRVIDSRTFDLYPEKSYAMTHSLCCIVSREVAEILNEYPESFALAVNTFCSSSISGSTSALDNKEMKQCLSAMSRFGAGLEDLVMLCTTQTRVLYAQLTFRPFQPPSKFHSALRRVQEYSKAASAKNLSAFDIGSRITCGLELANHLSLKTHCSGVDDDIASNSGMPQKDLMSYLVAEHRLRLLPSKNLQIDSIYCLGQPTSHLWTPKVPCHIVFSRMAADGRKKGATNARFYCDHIFTSQAPTAACACVIGSSDSEEWLYMTPEELDREMNERVSGYKSGRCKSDLSSKSSAAVKEDDENKEQNDNTSPQDNEDEKSSVADLQKAIDGLKSFFKGSSDFDGVRAPEVSSQEKKCKQHQSEESTNDVMNVDWKSAFAAIEHQVRNETANINNNGYFSDEEDEDDYEDSDEDDSAVNDEVGNRDLIVTRASTSRMSQHAPPEMSSHILLSSGGVATFTLPPQVHAHMAHTSSCRGDKSLAPLDSDDEQCETDSDDEEDSNAFDYDEYVAAMESELSHSSLIESFERFGTGGDEETRGGPGDVDVDTNLAKYLLESHALAMGSESGVGVGPASLLLNQLGLSLPTPSPSKIGSDTSVKK